jgi:hypothetical protein
MSLSDDHNEKSLKILLNAHIAIKMEKRIDVKNSEYLFVNLNSFENILIQKYVK